MFARRLVATLALLPLLAACAASSPEPPATRWDHRPEAPLWTASTISALKRDASPMLDLVPGDIATFCPGYPRASETERAAFWTALFSGLARYESTWNPRAAGAGGRYRGLLQILPQTARYRGCDLSHPDGLYDGATNLACAVRIAAPAVTRDGVVAGAPGRWGGIAADWPPLRDAAKRADIAAFTRAQPYCRG